MITWPFVLKRTYERLHDDYENAVMEKNEIRRENARLRKALEEARKNDERDPDTGRYKKARK